MVSTCHSVISSADKSSEDVLRVLYPAVPTVENVSAASLLFTNISRTYMSGLLLSKLRKEVMIGQSDQMSVPSAD